MKKPKSTKNKVSSKPVKKAQSTKSSLKDKILGLLFLVVALGVLLMPHPAPPQRTSSPLSKEPITIDKKLQESQKTENIPQRVVLPKYNIDLKTVPAKIVDGYWEISETDASYGLGSGLPGSKSNTVLFAHAREGLFFNLKDVKKGDIVYVLTQNKWHRYKINVVKEVYPNQKEVILPTKNETVTLYTCSGFNDEKRLIVTALPAK